MLNRRLDGSTEGKRQLTGDRSWPAAGNHGDGYQAGQLGCRVLNVAPVRIQGAGVARVHREVNVGDVITLLEAEHDESEIRTPHFVGGRCRS